MCSYPSTYCDSILIVSFDIWNKNQWSLSYSTSSRSKEINCVWLGDCEILDNIELWADSALKTIYNKGCASSKVILALLFMPVNSFSYLFPFTESMRSLEAKI